MVGKKPARELSRSQLYRRAAEYRGKLSDHEFGKKDALVAAGIVGGALATAAAIRAHRKRGSDITDAEGTRVTIHTAPAQYMKNTVSVVDAKGKSASFPEGPVEAERLRLVQGDEDVSLFAQEASGRTTYILRNRLLDSDLYRGLISRGVDIAMRALPLSRESEFSDEQQLREK